MKGIKKLLVGVIAVMMTFTLTSCGFIGGFINGLLMGLFQSEISLEYTLTEEDLTEFTSLIAECEEAGMDGTNVLAVSAGFMEMSDKLMYIDAQATIGYLEYCQDQTSETALAHYTQSESIFMSARMQYLALLKKLLLESPIKDDLFDGWSEEEKALLLVDNDKIGEIQLSNSEITRDFYELDEASETWSQEVAALYVDLVENNQKMAKEYGYEDYYALADKMIYSRNYTAEQRAAFRGYVADYIVPMYTEILDASEAAYAALTVAEQAEYAAIYSDRTYLDGYIDSFGYSMKNKMNNLFTIENAVIYGEGENALQGAFTTYMGYFSQPVVYFGPGYQDLYTVVHELGHYTAYYYFDDSTLPYDLAEVHSQGNEWLLTAYLQEEVSPKVYEALYLNNLATGLTTVMYATVVDHFEELVYTAETPIAADGYDEVMQLVCAQYEGLEEAMTLAGYRDPFSYAQYVTVSSPGYYLSYATSQIASIGVYLLAQENGYSEALAAYTTLQEGIDTTLGFAASIEAAGLLSPFAQETYVKLQETFLKD